MKKTGVLLFSMGGPEKEADVYPFLKKLFADPAILRIPAPIRFFLAKIIAKKRTKEALHIYRALGGGSPLRVQTEEQTKALQDVLGPAYFCCAGFSYTKPSIAEAVYKIEKEGCEEIVALPLYPQYSTATTESGFRAIEKSAKRKIKKIISYETEEGFIEGMAQRIEPLLFEAEKKGEVCLLFSAHGLPERIVQAGDPYPAQCEQTARALERRLSRKGTLCYQSRVGSLKWIGPATEDEIRAAARAGKAIVVVPIAFVCEHSETLYELSILNRQRAEEAGASSYAVAETVRCDPHFINGLARLVRSC